MERVPTGTFVDFLPLRFGAAILLSFWASLAAAPLDTQAGALEDYIRLPDASFQWKQTEFIKLDRVRISHLEFISQTWRGAFWSHHLQIVRPTQLKHPSITLLFITGDGDGQGDLEWLQPLAERVGARAAVLTQVPNQPLFEGLREDALIAHTFDQFLKTGDPTWPLLFPMVKSAVRAMDVIQVLAKNNRETPITQFLVCGASKRGWTTWLAAAADPRVKAIAPMVIDMLNMKTQAKWADRVYGRQSEKIHDYTDLNLIAKMDEPRMIELRGYVDPYSYRTRYRLPKLLLLGLNDPYWTVDSLRHYWADLPEPKQVCQTPNAGHDLGNRKQAIAALTAFFENVVLDKPSPKMTWQFDYSDPQKVDIKVDINPPPIGARLWTAQSSDRDFRNDTWYSQELSDATNQVLTTSVEAPSSGYRSFMIEVDFTSPSGAVYKLSTEARVIPDTQPEANGSTP